MSTIPPDNSNLDQLDEELVAYLDGELEPQAAQRLENTLATNEQTRRRLNQLANSWDLLDQLPRATVDDLFTRTTVEMVALAAEDEFTKAAVAPAKRWMRWLGCGIAVVCAALVGFAVMALSLPDQNDPLLRDLPVVQNLELYQSVTSIDFLKQLQAAKLFVEDAAEPATANVSSTDSHALNGAVNLAMSSPASMNDRRAWVQSLSTADKTELRNNLERFIALPTKEQQSLRDLDDALQHESQADTSQFRRVMDRYYEWWKTLSPIDRFNLSAESNPQKRVSLVEQIRSEQVRQVVSRVSGGWQILLKDSDSQAILRWMSKFARDHRSELPALTPEENRADAPRFGSRGGRPPMMLAYEAWWSPTPLDFPKVSDTEFRDLRSQLSPEKQAVLENTPGLSDRVRLVRSWAQTAWHELRDAVDQGAVRWGNFNPSRERLTRFLNQELSPSERKEIQNVPDAEERNRKLLDLYLQKHRPPEFQRPGGPPPRPGSEPPPREPANSGDAGKARPSGAADK